METSAATLMRRHPLGETSWIVQWCCASHGLIRTVAKGARSPKSPFAGKLDLFHQCEIAWAPARRGHLHHLRECALLSPRPGLRTGYERTLAAAYFGSLVELVAEPDTPIPEIHSLLTTALDWLDGHPPSRRAVFRFENHLARLLGMQTKSGSGAAALLHNFHRLPKQRQPLLDLLPAPQTPPPRQDSGIDPKQADCRVGKG